MHQKTKLIMPTTQEDTPESKILSPHRINRFRFLSWSLSAIEQSPGLRKPDFPFPERTKKTKYPIRALRYWWLACAIQDELQKKNGSHPVTIADLGCKHGILKRFMPPIPGSYWIGMDLQMRPEDLKIARYDEVHCCDFDKTIPIKDSTADIVVCSMVLEHLPRPDWTMGELARILRPGGMMLIGVPVVPRIISIMREWQFARQFKAGTRHSGNHMHAFWPARIRHIAERVGLNVEFLSGSYLLRMQGSWIENSSCWMRVNQFWGAMFPSLSQELCMQLRKPLS